MSTDQFELISDQVKQRREAIGKLFAAGVPFGFGGIVVDDGGRGTEALEEITARNVAAQRWINYAFIIGSLTGTTSARLPIEEHPTQYSVPPGFPHGNSTYHGGVFALQDLLMYLGPVEAFLRGFLSPPLNLDLTPLRLFRLAGDGGTLEIPQDGRPEERSGNGEEAEGRGPESKMYRAGRRSGNGETETPERPGPGYTSGWGNVNGDNNFYGINNGVYIGTIYYICPRGCTPGSLPGTPRSGGEYFTGHDSTEYVPEGTMFLELPGNSEAGSQPGSRKKQQKGKNGRRETGTTPNGNNGGEDRKPTNPSSGNREDGQNSPSQKPALPGSQILPLPASYQEVVREVNEIFKRYGYKPIAEVKTPADVMREVEYEKEFIIRKDYSLIPGSSPSPIYDPQRRILVTPESEKERKMPENIVKEIEGIVKKYTGLGLHDWYKNYKRDLFPC